MKGFERQSTLVSTGMGISQLAGCSLRDAGLHIAVPWHLTRFMKIKPGVGGMDWLSAWEVRLVGESME